jgi:SAM-dependent methyltransferase
VQLTNIVDPEEMFTHYVYIPSTAKTMVIHFTELANKVLKKISITPGSLVVDIGSNDGTLLSVFKQKGMSVLGIDPAENLVAAANNAGIPSIASFFSQETAKKVVDDYGHPKIITATNVMAHVPDTNSFVAGVRTLLDSDGTFVAEFPYGLELLKRYVFDTVYHEHVFYFTMSPLNKLFSRHGLEIYHIDKLPTIHGGSIRIYVQHKGRKKGFSVDESVGSLLDKEKIYGLDTPNPYMRFQKRAYSVRDQFTDFLEEQEKAGKTVIGYGASAKATVLLNFCNVTRKQLPLVVDSVPLKHGKWIPGVRIPIYPETDFLSFKADFGVIFPWNFANEIITKNPDFVSSKGKFVIAFPKLHFA